MDKNKVKAFSTWARNNLIEGVKDRAYKIGIENNNIKNIEEVQGGFKVEGKEEIFNISPDYRRTLVEEIEKKGFEQVMEECAYTWFNRLIALRYMEVNDYMPTGIRIVSSQISGKLEPDILSRVGEVILDLNLDSTYVYELLDSDKNADREKLYKYILVKQCNELGKIIPGLFEKITDYTELLLPDNLLMDGSIISTMSSSISEADWKEEVEIIGWIYQYYISEKKDMVFDGLKKNVKITKENIPAATQLFTPKWIVKYLVENSIGSLWLQGHPNEEIERKLEYYIKGIAQETEVDEVLKSISKQRSTLSPEDIKILDPCMGSGHILIYAFDVLYEIYKVSGYSEREIPRKILENNIFGLDIDDRASQLAGFALIMKARGYNKRLFRELEKKPLCLNIASIEDSNSITYDMIEYFAKGNEELREAIVLLINNFKDGKEYGSILKIPNINLKILSERLEEIESEINLTFSDYKTVLIDKLPALIKQGEIMSVEYDICITNPPYMGLRGANDTLAKYLSDYYPHSKHDLFSVYMEVCNSYIKENGLYAMVNQHSWMFLSSFLELRKKLVYETTFINMVHLGPRAFEDNVGTIVQNVAFVNQKSKISKYKTRFIDVTKEMNGNEKDKKIKGVCSGINKEIVHDIWIEKLMTIPTKPFAYWVSDNILKLFSSLDKFENMAKPRQGMATSDNKRFLREWYEVDINRIKFMATDSEDAFDSKKKWFPYNKGGEFRKWFGNNRFIINWENNGAEVKEYAAKLYKSYSRTVKNEEFYFKSGLTYTFISEDMGVRYSPQGFIFDVAGSSIFFNDVGTEKVILALLCSKVANMFLDIMNPTYNIQVGDLKNIPINNEIFEEKTKKVIDEIVGENIEISKREWDSFETSWDFNVHPLINNISTINEVPILIRDKFKQWDEENLEAIARLKANEEKLNKIFIDIYGLNNELSPEVNEKDITLRKADVEKEMKSFVSYAVGCIMGRYSIDVYGLVYGGGDFKDKWDIDQKQVKNIVKNLDADIVSETYVDTRFIPKLDNIVPITEEEYFEEDIVSKFIEFVEKVYGNATLEENLDYITLALGRKENETSRQCIRRYFVKDFYKDHLKIYSKKPIYWLFDSGKNDGFKALIYVHRYDESTIARVRTEYLHPTQRKYDGELNRLTLIVESNEYSVKEKTLAKKKSDRIKKQIEELMQYDQIVSHIANEKMIINLDNGIKDNYDKFQNKKIPNRNGKQSNMNLFFKV
ncbi:MAG: BREX-1 system adenine-specific DNA-methyltransferase PglX [Clostridium sp.]|uniref:BREX-1 system adenine-specific DNA-methyltransferase PglX n=1 Tax=Clostridium sp. TaxID=1506 RepID=UPI0030349B5F